MKDFSNKKLINIEKKIKKGWKIDKAKIKYLANNVNQIQNIIENLSYDSRVIKSFESNDFKKCSKNFLVECKNGSVYIGVGGNSPKGVFCELQKTVVIEYNPQKVDIFKEISYLKELKFLPHHRRKIMYIDCAYDMYININNIQYLKRRKNEYECVISHHEKETVYLRAFGRNGSTRIYNKVIEMNGGIDEDIDFDTGELIENKYFGECTRYEIRVKPIDDLQLQPFCIEQLIQLHELSICADEQLIIDEMKKEKSNDFKNLYMVHIGMLEMLDKNKKNMYIEKYKNIKNKAVLENRLEVLKDYNIDSLSKVIYYYLDYIIQEKESKILINPLYDELEFNDEFVGLVPGHDEKFIKCTCSTFGVFLFNDESEK